MSREEQITNVKKKLIECRKELEGLRGDISSSELQKVKSSINSSISFLNRASKQMSELTPLKGQMNLFDYMNNDGDFNLSENEKDLEEPSEYNEEEVEYVDYFEL